MSPSPVAYGQQAVEYRVELDQPQTQMVGVSVRVPEVEGPELLLSLPTWRPGRYEILDPAGSLRELTARSGSGRELRVGKVDKSTWRVEPAGSETVEVSYQIYANSLSDRTRHVDDSHAFLSGSTVFLYSPAHRNRPVIVRIEAPAEWRVATGLEPAWADPRILAAASYDVLVDSPIEVGLHDLIELEIAGKPHEIVVWPMGARYDRERLIEDSRKIVEQQLEIFGVLPYERYVFLNHVGAGAGGGTEHLNSTIMQTSFESFEGSHERNKAYRRYLGLVSHEFFHTWNVKQLRPAGIHPYDYQNENYTELFWVSEGTTSYYSDLTLVRAGLIQPKHYFEALGKLIDSYRTRPGARVQSVAESSYDAWIKFNRRNPDSVNSTVSFYSQGKLVSLALDLEIRKRSRGSKSLDDVMRDLFERFPLSGSGFTNGDLLLALERAAGSPFDGFYADHIAGTEPLDLNGLLATVGLELYLEEPKDRDAEEDGQDSDTVDEGIGVVGDARPRDQGTDTDDQDEPSEEGAVLDLELRNEDGKTVVAAVLAGGPAYAAGVLAGDEIVALDGRRLEEDELEDRLEAYLPGDRVLLHVMRYDRLRSFEIELGSRPRGSWRVRHQKDSPEGPRETYRRWLGQAWPETEEE